MYKILLLSILITSSLFSQTLIILPFHGIEYNDNISISEMFNEHISKTETIKVINSSLLNYKLDNFSMKEYNEIIMNEAKKSNADYALFGYLSKIDETKKLNIKLMNVKNGNIIYTHSWSFEYIERIEYQIANRIHIDIVTTIIDNASMQF